MVRDAQQRLRQLRQDVAVGLARTQHVRRRQRAARAGTVLHDHALSQRFARVFGQRAQDDAAGAAGGVGVQQGNRFGGDRAAPRW